MRGFTSQVHVLRHAIWDDQSYLWFVELQVTDTLYARLVRNPVGLEAANKKWQPTSLEIDVPGEDLDGSLGQIVVSLPNTSRIAGAYAELQSGYLGRKLTVYIAHESDLSAFIPAMTYTHLVRLVEVTERVIKITASHPVEAVALPAKTFTRQAFPQLLPSAGLRNGGL